MSILGRYISMEFIKILLLSLGAFIAVYLVIDIFQGIGMMVEHKPAFRLVAALYLLKIPRILSQVTPVAVLLSTLMTLGLLSRNSEVTAMKSSGISLYKIVFPILVIAFMVSLFSLFSNEYIVPHTNREAMFIEKVAIKKKSRKSFFRQNKIWYRGDNAIYNIQLFEPDTNTLKGVTIYYIGDGFSLSKRIEAKEAVWEGASWRFYDVREDIFDNGGIMSNSYRELPVRFPETPETFGVEERDSEEMGFWELREYISKLRSEGYDSTRLVVDLYSKLSSPFTALVMAFLGIPFALKGGRSAGIAFGVGISVLIGFGYWLVMSFGLSLGRAEALPPLLSAWGANIVFGLTGILMMMKVEGD